MVSGVALQLGGIPIRSRNVAIISLAELESLLGHRVDGILGADVFRAYVVDIDYEARMVTLHTPREYMYSGAGQTVPLALAGVPFLEAAVSLPGQEPKLAHFVIDTASVGPLVLSTAFVQSNGLLDDRGKLIERPSYGVGGETKELIGRIDSLRIGPYVLEQPVTEFSTATSGLLAADGADGIIGNEILQRFRVIMDYRRLRMILEPNSSFQQPFETDMSGLLLVSEGKSLEQIKVARVFDDSPAAQSGLREGDVILSVDDSPIDLFTVEDLTELFRQHGRRYHLGVQRGNEMLEIELATMRLV
jgi:hypothetical protein